MNTMIDVMKKDNLFLKQFEQFERDAGRDAPPFLRRIRNAAIARYAELGLPTARNEDWKFTNVAPLVQIPFQMGRQKPELVGDPGRVAGLDARNDRALVFLNGASYDSRNLESNPYGILALNLRRVLIQQMPLIEPHLARYAKYDDQPFTAINTALIDDGAFLYVPPNIVVEEPIHLLFLTMPPGEPIMTNPRNLIIIGENSQVRLVEWHVGGDTAVNFTNAVTEIVVGQRAIVDHYKVQQESKIAFHIASTHVHQETQSTFSTHYIGLGGQLVRNEVRVRFDGEGAEATVNGLYQASGRQHMDNFTVIDHAKPRCASHELYRGMLSDQAHGVFNGKILVREDAQKTDAKQTNQTLLLSDSAVINTKPQLEIFADDVKCTHGATVGQLNEEALFYLRARGIGREEARRLLMFAFANDIIEKIKVDSLRTQLETLFTESQGLSQE